MGLRSRGFRFGKKGGRGVAVGLPISPAGGLAFPGFQLTDHPDLTEARSIGFPFLRSDDNDRPIVPLS